MKKKFKLFCHFCNTIPIIVVFCLKRIIFRFKEVLSSKPKICLLIDINISILHGQTLFEHFIKIGSKEIRLLLYCTTLVCGQIINQRGMVMMGNLTHSKNLKWKKGQKLVGIKKLWMVRELFEKYSIRPPK